MNHLVQTSLALRGRNAPLFGRGLLQHQARRRAAFPHHTEETAHRVGAIGILIAIFRVADGLLQLDAFPIGFHLIGQDQRDHGPAAGSHFRAMGHDQHRAIRLDAHKHVGGEDRGFQRGQGWSGNHAGAQHQRAGSKGLPQEGAAAEVADGFHACSFAADLMAARMR